MAHTEDLNRYQDAYQANFKFSSENHLMLKWYASYIIQNLKENNDINMLSLGIGHQTVSCAIIEALAKRLKKYAIVEGSEAIIQQYKAEVQLPPNVEIIHGYFETFTASAPFDVIEMGFILEHVDDPHLILTRYKSFLKNRGTLFIAVPNATSLHRMLGHKAGLLNDPFSLSSHDLALGHKRYFDLESLKDLALKSGLRIKDCQGIYLKPFTTAQINSLSLPEGVIQAMFEVGSRYPELCNAILLEATI